MNILSDHFSIALNVIEERKECEAEYNEFLEYFQASEYNWYTRVSDTMEFIKSLNTLPVIEEQKLKIFPVVRDCGYGKSSGVIAAETHQKE